VTGSGEPRPNGVDVVIPYYRDQPMLDRILGALRDQRGLDTGADRGRPDRLHIIVADDGSPTPPTVPDGVTVVRHEDRGFRASAARHLGARAGHGEILLFLDGDTVPGPHYVAAMVAALDGHPDLLVVGRRRHGRFATGPPTAGTSHEPVEILPDPAWPAAFYAETGDLTRGDDLWRGVLSAVCGLHRRLYDLAGGFDPAIVGYGGEDWDLAWRCEQAGGRLRYVKGAVAWHDGPDWHGRASAAHDHLAQKNTETARLAPLIASPHTRPAGAIFALPTTAVHVHADDPTFAATGSTAATCASLLGWGDVAVTVDPASPDAPLLAELFGGDPRVTVGARPRWWQAGVQGEGPRRRPPILVDLHRPCTPGTLDVTGLRALCPAAGSATIDDDEGRPLARIRSSRALAREQVWGDRPPPAPSIPAAGPGAGPLLEPLRDDGFGVRLERFFGGW